MNCLRVFTEQIRNHMEISQVILFGSYAKGTAHDESDIDVAVVVEKLTEDWLDTSAKLFRVGRGIDLSIEPVLIDSTTDTSGFLAEIRRSGEIVYDASHQ